MVGITSYAAYIPWCRIQRMSIYAAMGWLNPASLLPGEKAVANYDEDSISLAANAAHLCVGGLPPEEIDGVYFATTTAPYAERQNAGIIGSSLDLRSDVRTSDFTDSVKSGTGALIAAYDAIKSGSAQSIVVATADCRLGKPGAYLEEMYGDAAAALLVGNSKVIASIEGTYSTSHDFVDHWRWNAGAFNRNWEDRWIRDEGYGKHVPEAISGLLQKYNIKPSEIAKLVFPCMYTAAHSRIAKNLGFNPDQVQDHMFTQIGHAGAAYPLVLLAAALETAKPGDKVIVVSYGNGCDALLLQVTDEITKMTPQRSVAQQLAHRKDLTYERFLVCSDVLDIDTGGRGDDIGPSPMSSWWRHSRAINGLVGSQCKSCGSPQFPPQRICANPSCGAVDEIEDYRFAGRKAKLSSYTGDMLAFSYNPPAVYGYVDFDGGGRMMLDVTDTELESCSVDMPVELTFRRKYRDPGRGVSGYFWKAIPVIQ